jgi:Leucine-rich repeat (LRR) protein
LARRSISRAVWARGEVSEAVVTELPPIDELRDVQTLDLSGNNLEALPPGFDELQDLRVLSLRGNRFAEVPPELARLERLDILDLSFNHLETLPGAISQLARLARLNLAGNRITELPPALARMTSLTWLDLAGNELAEIPPAVLELNALRILDLGQASYAGRGDTLPSFTITAERTQGRTLRVAPRRQQVALKLKVTGFELTREERPQVRSNRLVQLPAAIGQLRELLSLSLDHNLLTELPAEIGRLRNLQHLSVRGNLLASLPDEVARLRRLHGLVLDRNRLTGLPDLRGMDQLLILDLDNNDIAELPPWLAQLKSLRRYMWRRTDSSRFRQNSATHSSRACGSTAIGSCRYRVRSRASRARPSASTTTPGRSRSRA